MEIISCKELLSQASLPPGANTVGCSPAPSASTPIATQYRLSVLFNYRQLATHCLPQLEEGPLWHSLLCSSALSRFWYHRPSRLVHLDSRPAVQLACRSEQMQLAGGRCPFDTTWSFQILASAGLCCCNTWGDSAWAMSRGSGRMARAPPGQACSSC